MYTVIDRWLGLLERWMSTWLWSRRNSLERQWFARSSCATTERRTCTMKLWRWISRQIRSSSVPTSPPISSSVALCALHILSPAFWCGTFVLLLTQKLTLCMSDAVVVVTLPKATHRTICCMPLRRPSAPKTPQYFQPWFWCRLQPLLRGLKPN